MSEYPKGRYVIEPTGILVSIKWREDSNWMTVSANLFGYETVRKYLEAKVIRWKLVYDHLSAFGFEPITIEAFQERRERGGPSKEFMDNLREELKRRLSK